MIKIYEKGMKRMPFIKAMIVEREIVICVVDENGNTLANLLLWDKDEGCMRGAGEAKQILESGGFSTSWAEWSNNGTFMRLK